MDHKPTRSDEILDVAEKMARTGGYNGFSFREIAKEIGIKAASVHYHFPGKEDLGVALARRYTERFMDALGDPNDQTVEPGTLIGRYINAYRASLIDDGLMCLCGMLGAETAYLPKAVSAEAKLFFEANHRWLVQVIVRKTPTPDTTEANNKALHMIATLEGALILAHSLEDPTVFDAATGTLTQI